MEESGITLRRTGQPVSNRRALNRVGTFVSNRTTVELASVMVYRLYGTESEMRLTGSSGVRSTSTASKSRSYSKVVART